VTTIVRRDAPHSPKLSQKLVVYWAERMLAVLDRAEAELSVLLTNDSTIAELNRDYRHKDRPTDVLSFHFESAGIPSAIEAGWLLGDIVISLDTAARQAQSRKRPLEEEVRWLLAHGILHLVGYDHATPEEKRVMVAWTRKLVRAAGDAPPALRAPHAAKTSNLGSKVSNLGSKTSNLASKVSNLGSKTSNLASKVSNLGSKTSNSRAKPAARSTKTSPRAAKPAPSRAKTAVRSTKTSPRAAKPSARRTNPRTALKSTGKGARGEKSTRTARARRASDR
jgi:probable rRNA maturation factor